MPSGYTSGTARRIAGISQRCLDYWDEKGLVKPSKTGRGKKRKARAYSYDDLLKLKVVKRLRELGVSIKKMAKAVHQIKARDPCSEPLLEVLITDGKQVWRRRADGKIEELLNVGQLVFSVIDLDGIEEEVIRRLPKGDEHAEKRTASAKGSKASRRRTSTRRGA